MPRIGKEKRDREMYVVKANDLIRNSRFSLTLQQQKIVLFAISKIQPKDSIFTWYEFSIADICKTCGMNIDDGGIYYTALKDDLEKLTERKWGVTPDGSLKTISWIGDVDFKTAPGKVRIIFNPNMEPLLFELKEHYTQYQLKNVLLFNSAFSIRLYELLRSYATPKVLSFGEPRCFEFSLEELKARLDTGAYNEWYDFKKYVLQKAIDEINAKTEDLQVKIFPQKEGRRVVSVKFEVSPARALQNIIVRQKQREKFGEN